MSYMRNISRRPLSNRRLLAACLAVAWSLAGAAAAAPFTPEEAARVDALVSKVLADNRAPSASVAVVRNGEIVFARAYGLRRLAGREAAGIDTRYRIASISKQFTAAAVLMLADEGKVSLDDPIVKHLPELGAANRATIRQTMSHTAGFPEFWTVDYTPLAVKASTSPQAIVARWGAERPDFAPGSKWSYSNTGYVALGRLVERVSGSSLAGFLEAHVLKPLGMSSAVDVDGRSVGAADATGYERAALGPPRPAETPARGWTMGCGELSMTASDLARWDISLIDRRLMSKKAYAALETEARLADGSGTGYGLGVFLDTVGGHRRVRHNGQLPGFWSENRIYPDDSAAVVVLVNASYGASPEAQIANGLEQMVIPAAAGPPPPVSPEQLAALLYRQIMAGSLDRTRLTPDASAYLSGPPLADYRRSFEGLGLPLASIPLHSESTRGVETRSWVLVWPSAKLVVTLRVEQDGKVSEFMAVPVWEKAEADGSAVGP